MRNCECHNQRLRWFACDLPIFPNGTSTRHGGLNQKWLGMGWLRVVPWCFVGNPETLAMKKCPITRPGKQPHNYGKSPFLMGTLTISRAMFNSFLYVYQRVVMVWAPNDCMNLIQLLIMAHVSLPCVCHRPQRWLKTGDRGTVVSDLGLRPLGQSVSSEVAEVADGVGGASLFLKGKGMSTWSVTIHEMGVSENRLNP